MDTRLTELVARQPAPEREVVYTWSGLIARTMRDGLYPPVEQPLRPRPSDFGPPLCQDGS